MEPVAAHASRGVGETRSGDAVAGWCRCTALPGRKFQSHPAVPPGRLSVIFEDIRSYLAPNYLCNALLKLVNIIKKGYFSYDGLIITIILNYHLMKHS